MGPRRLHSFAWLLGQALGLELTVRTRTAGSAQGGGFRLR